MIFCLMLLSLLGLSFVVQEFLPAISWAYQSRLMLVPVVFFAGAVSVPFPMMLAFAFFTGFVWDARHLVITPQVQSFLDPAAGATANPTFGYSIVLYALLGSLMQGIRPLFRRGRWELPVLMTGVATALLLVIEYLWISFLRGGFCLSRGHLDEHRDDRVALDDGLAAPFSAHPQALRRSPVTRFGTMDFSFDAHGDPIRLAALSFSA